jgi:hypothetical protein
MYMYKGVGIQPEPSELLTGGWNGDFTLIDQEPIKYWGKEIYSTREDAIRAALDFAQRIIDDDE